MGPHDEQESLLGDNAVVRGIDPYVLPVLLMMVVGLIFFLPKIYMSNNIYLTSLKIERSKTALMILQDENQQLRREMEAQSFKMENP